MTKITILLILCAICVIGLHAFEEESPNPPDGARKRNKRNRKRSNPERLALKKWAESLTDADYDRQHWHDLVHSNTGGDFFHHYARKLSNVFKKAGSKLNFALVGACDGDHDRTITNLYIPNNHWRGVFVEPMSINVRDLITYLADHEIAHRSLVLRGAATLECKEPTIKVERPLYEEMNKSMPHWVRRQIGKVLPTHREEARKEWTIEEVRCLTGETILSEWTAGGSSGSKASGANAGYFNGEVVSISKEQQEMVANNLKAVKRRRRPHILKIDVEGHDYEVLMSFLRPDTPLNQLPLLIEFEAKSIAHNYDKAQARMEALGYVMTPYDKHIQDGFAILPAQKVLESLQLQDHGVPGDTEPDV